MGRFGFHKLFFLIFICGCCVDKFDTFLLGEKILVVDGLVTDQAGPQTVILSYSSGLGVGEVTRGYASGAEVTLVDTSGFQVQLLETEKGVYQTDSNYKGQIGKSYFIRISLNKEIYESDIETMLPAGQLDSLYFEFQTTSTASQFNIYANSSKVKEGSGQMRWRSSFVYRIFTYPGLALEPPPCAVGCTCCECWVYGKSVDASISDRSNFINDKYNSQLVEKLVINRYDQRFQPKYYLTVDQLSISQNAYNFWKLVKSQQTGSNSLFQPASARIKGNIHSVTNPAEQILGLFQVSSVVSKSIFIKLSDIPISLQPVPLINPIDCRTTPATTTRPSFW